MKTGEAAVLLIVILLLVLALTGKLDDAVNAAFNFVSSLAKMFLR